MKILVVANNFPVTVQDFAAAFALPFVTELRRQGHAVTVLSLMRNTPWRDADDGTVLRIDASGTQGDQGGFRVGNPFALFMYWRLDRRAKKALGNLIKKNRFDLGLALWAEPSGRWLAWAKRRFNLPFAVWCLGSDILKAGRGPVMRSLLRKTLRAANLIYADGFALAGETRRLSGRECSFLPTTRTLPPPGPRRRDGSDNIKTFVFIGRLEPVKGIDLLIRAFAAAKMADCRLDIYGTGSMKEACEAIIQASGAEKTVEMKGHADGQAIADRLSEAHCCAIPSRQESIPVVLSEALQCGCPILVTRVGDMGTIVDRFGVGLAVPPGDVEALSRGLREMAAKNRPEFINGMAAALATFSLTSAVSRFLSDAQTAFQQ